MAIIRVQKNGAFRAGTNSALMPAWGSTTVAGNLLLLVVSESSAANGTWTTTPAGWTAFAPSPFTFNTTSLDGSGLFWKIAAGGDATPGTLAESGVNVADWTIYTYEFSSPTGWLSTPSDKEVHSAAGAVLGTTKASGSTATLAQANELCMSLLSTTNAVTACTFSAGYTLDNPATANGTSWVGWQEVNATTAQSTTATWTGSQVNCCRIFTFKTGPVVALRPALRVVRRTWAGR